MIVRMVSGPIALSAVSQLKPSANNRDLTARTSAALFSAFFPTEAESEIVGMVFSPQWRVNKV
jgi:hypothetical protein